MTGLQVAVVKATKAWRSHECALGVTDESDWTPSGTAGKLRRTFYIEEKKVVGCKLSQLWVRSAVVGGVSL